MCRSSWQMRTAAHPLLMAGVLALVAAGCAGGRTAPGNDGPGHDPTECADGEPDCEATGGDPDVCVERGLECGEATDALGELVVCGQCGSDELCVDGTCEADPTGCAPLSCVTLDRACGEWSDGCGGMLACGGCAGGMLCDAGACVDPDTLAHERVANPFAGAGLYVSPEYAEQVRASGSLAPAALTAAVAELESIPTAVWLDRIAMIDGDGERMGIQAHLEAALAQQAGSDDPDRPLLVSFVVYDLPNRDCAAFASNGELKLEENGMQRYRAEYIDAIVERLSASPLYSKLRIVTVIEPDSLPNLVTNLGIYEKCRRSADAYREGVTYAVSRLSELDNVYIYLDIAHSGWLGWEHTQTAAQLYREVLAEAGGEARVTGFATNVANYSALEEPFNPYTDVNANRDLIEGFYEWNRMIDEVSYVAKLREYFPDHGFIIDTSRNGWAWRGPKLPIEDRTHRGNWCNISGAGLGERPQANPRPGVHAYFWIKPPGESDGTSDAGATTANDEGKSYDKMCGAAPVERPYAPGEAIPTDALPGAPHAGHWFHEQLLMLVENATPALRTPEL